MSSNYIIDFAVSILVLIVAIVIAVISPSTSTLALLVLIAGYVIYSAIKTSIQSGLFSTSGNQNSSLHEQQQHKLLLESIHHLPMPYALYDKDDRLCVWNEHYEDIYARAFERIKTLNVSKNLTYGEMLRLNVDGKMSGEKLDEYIENRIKTQRSPEGKTVDQFYPDRGWFRVSKFETLSGGVAGFAIDINELKERETELMQEIEHRKKLEKEIREIANTDLLTGIPNRRHFMETAEREFELAKTNNETLPVLMLDIDHFKNVNDTYGHASGDDVIATVAKIFDNVLKSKTGQIGRMGGEEFAAVLPGVSMDEAYNLANLVRETIENLTFFADGEHFMTTASIGVSETWPSDSNVSVPLQRADVALYQAKAQGRNCVCRHTPADGDQLDLAS